MCSSDLMKRPVAVLLSLAAMACCGSAAAAGAYKCIDGAGRSTYSDRPCPDAKQQTVVRTAPAMKGHSLFCNGYDCPDAGRSGAMDRLAYEDMRMRQLAAREETERSSAEAAAQKRAEMIRECERQRNIDCNSDATLRALQNQNIPRRGRW